MTIFSKPWLLLVLSCLIVSRFSANSENVQFCKSGAGKSHLEESVNFCMSMATHQNLSSNSHDIYVTMSVPHFSESPLGWTSIGIGSEMMGALMFIIYGDPLGSTQPTISIRTARGYSQPIEISKPDMGGDMDIRVLEASWRSTEANGEGQSAASLATVSLVCHSCESWSRSEISMLQNSQPWLWAWNSEQHFSEFTTGVDLASHKHDDGAGGTGRFYVDMTRSITASQVASIPQVDPSEGNIGTSETPKNIASGTQTPLSQSAFRRFSSRYHNTLWNFHGFFLGLAFVVLFPAGAVAIRWGSPKSFTYHWILQLSAFGLALIGGILGLVLRPDMSTTHQKVGVGILSILGLQGFLGWRHHVIFMKTRRRTLNSTAHVWLGRLVTIVGWGNILSGLSLRRFSTTIIALTLGFVAIEFVLLAFWLWSGQRRKSRSGAMANRAWGMEQENYFVIGDDDAEEEACASVIGDGKEEEEKLVKNSEQTSGES